MAAIAATTDRRFRRAHVKPARRKSVVARGTWAVARAACLVSLVVLGLWRGATAVASAPALQIGHIAIHGFTRVSTGEALALLEGLRGQNILTVALEPWREKLLTVPWIEEASLRRELPSTLHVTVRERRPMGIGRFGAGLYLLDERGVLIDAYGPNYADIDLPIIDGLDVDQRDGRTLVEPTRLALAARVMTALGARPSVAQQVSQIDVSDSHDAVAILDGSTTVLHLGEADFVERVQQYLDLADGLRQRVGGIDAVDLRFDQRVYVRRLEPAGRAPK